MRIRSQVVGLATLVTLGLGGAVASAAPAGKVDVCHREGNGSAHVINISANAVRAHLRHGDSLAGTFWADADGDGFGDAGAPTAACPGDGLVDNDDDCDDANAIVYPGAPEIPYDGLDNDCDAGTIDDDFDGDGFGIADDCDDTDAGTHPGAAEVCGDGIDQSCDGFVDEGCVTECPCFGTDELDAAYEVFLANKGEYKQNYYECWVDTSAPHTGTDLRLFNDTSTDAYRDVFMQRFYGWGYDPYYGDSYCNQITQDFYKDNATGEVTKVVHEDFHRITPEELLSCEATLQAWTDAAGLVCAAY